MKKVLRVLSIGVLLIALTTACQQSKEKIEQTETSESTDSTSHEQMAGVSYTCSMHPEVVSDKPGKCPKCGMELVEKENGDEE